MPLPWVRLDTAFPYNPKLLAMLSGERDGHRAAVTYLSSLCYAGATGTDGFIPREALPFIHGRDADAACLVRHSFWIPQAGGWLIKDWADFQESNEETRARRLRAQAGAAARWNGHEPMSSAERSRRWRERKKGGDDATSNVTSIGT
jgi:hypothetical protein